MSNVLLAHVEPNINTNTVLFNVDQNNAYFMCQLIITSMNDSGIIFNAAISKETTPNAQDYIYTNDQPILNDQNVAINHYIINDIFLAQGENFIISTPLPNMSFRLTGYPYPYTNQVLNIN